MADIMLNSLYLVKDKIVFILELFTWKRKQAILQDSRPLKHSPHFTGFYRILGFLLDFEDSAESQWSSAFYRILQDSRPLKHSPHFIGFYRISGFLLDFEDSAESQRSSAFYRILQDSIHFIGFYRIFWILCLASFMLMEHYRFLIFQIFKFLQFSGMKT